MSDVVTAHRPGAAAWVVLIRCETAMVVRDTAGLVVPLGLPLLVLLMSAPAAGDHEVTPGRSALDAFVLPLVLTIVVATIGIINMPSFLAYYRRTGILRRLSVTPASPVVVLVAQVVVSLGQAFLGIGAALAVAVLAFDAGLPEHPVAWLGVLLLGTSAMYALGMAVASVAPTPNSAVAIGLVVFFALGALGGMFGGPDALPEALAPVGEVLPFGATVDVLAATWVGTPVESLQLVSLAGTVVVGVAVAAATFRWD